ncbi:MAG TPA: hypothetical protein VN540_04425 [Clostridia bacterium]|nr:hypothetical protein [Clostridia bacterium]
MMYADVDVNEMKKYILDKFAAEGDFSFLKEGELPAMVDALMALDEEYMKGSGADAGEVYDDDAAFERIFEGMKVRFPQYKMYAMRLAEDYMDFAEEYLGSVGAIEWE